MNALKRQDDYQLPGVSVPDGYCLIPAAMGAQLEQLAAALPAILRRLQELEESRAVVTVSHEDVKRLAAFIRQRADEYCEKDALDPAARKAVRAAIKKDLLTRAQVKDLHDIPAIALPGIVNQVKNWTSIRLAMSLRAKSGGG